MTGEFTWPRAHAQPRCAQSECRQLHQPVQTICCLASKGVVCAIRRWWSQRSFTAARGCHWTLAAARSPLGSRSAMSAIVSSLARIVGSEFVSVPTRRALRDASGVLSERARGAAWVRPGQTSEVAEILRWCDANDVCMTPRGGGTGLAGGAVPLDGAVVIALDRMRRVGRVDTTRWSMEVEAGVTTATVHRLARESGLSFPPDPGAAEQSQIGGNLATNAGGPHALKYGAVRSWVRAIDLVVPGGDVLRFGADVTKDSSTLDLARLVVGSEGTLGVITRAVLRLTPAPESAEGGLMFFDGVEAGASAVAALNQSGAMPSAVEFLDEDALAVMGRSCPVAIPPGARFVLLVEFDGTPHETRRGWSEAVQAVGAAPVLVVRAGSEHELAALWRWRQGVPGVVTTLFGGFVSDDVVVPIDHLAEVVGCTSEIGQRLRIPSCCFGHAGDGNVHATFMVDTSRPEEFEKGREAADELMRIALSLGGTIAGEHGVGQLKSDALRVQCGPEVSAVQSAVMSAFDPKMLMNPGKKGRPAGPAPVAPMYSASSPIRRLA